MACLGCVRGVDRVSEWGGVFVRGWGVPSSTGSGYVVRREEHYLLLSKSVILMTRQGRSHIQGMHGMEQS